MEARDSACTALWARRKLSCASAMQASGTACSGGQETVHAAVMMQRRDSSSSGLAAGEATLCRQTGVDEQASAAWPQFSRCLPAMRAARMHCMQTLTGCRQGHTFASLASAAQTRASHPLHDQYLFCCQLGYHGWHVHALQPQQASAA